MAKKRADEEKRTPEASRKRSSSGGNQPSAMSEHKSNGDVESRTPAKHHGFSETELNARIARKAFELFLQRGSESGRDVEDWLEAERQVKEELNRDREAGRA